MKFTDLLFQNESFTREKKRCYGMHKGYYVTAEKMDYDVFGIVQFGQLDDVFRQGLVSTVATLQQTHKRCDIVVNQHFVQIHIRISYGYKKEVAKLENCIDTIINSLAGAGIGTGCAYCGSEEPLQISTYDNVPKLICPNCLQGINEQIQMEASKPKVKSSIIPGTIGALLGSLVGVVVWFIIYRMGYISALGGLAMAVGAMWGYEKLGRSLDVKGVIISVVIVLGMVYVTNRFCWSYELKSVLEQYGAENVSLGDCFRNLEDVVKEVDCSADYFGDLAKGYILTVVGLISMVVGNLKSKR